MPAPKIQLDYVGPTTDAAPRRRSIGWTILALPTLLIPFVHFGCDVSPVGALIRGAQDARAGSRDLDATVGCILAAGLCYGALAFVWRVAIRWADRNPAARALGLSVGAAGAAATIFILVVFVCEVIRQGAAAEEWAAFTAGAASLLGALWLLWVIRRRRRRKGELVLGSLLTPFIAIGVLCLVAYFTERKVGWYLTLFSVPVSAVELITMAYARDRPSPEQQTAGPIRPAVVVSSSSS